MSKHKLLLTEEGLQKLRDRIRKLVEEFMEVSATKGEAAEFGGDGNSMKVKIGGHAEADLNKGIISYQSPLGLALMGAKMGRACEYKVGDKVIEVIVKSVLG